MGDEWESEMDKVELETRVQELEEENAVLRRLLMGSGLSERDMNIAVNALMGRR